MKKKRIWRIAAAVLVVVTAVLLLLYIRMGNSTGIVEKTGLSTGVQNRLMAYDEDTGVYFMGTYQNKLMAYKDNEKLWEMDAKGPFCRLVLNQEDGYLYAGNEDTHIYVVDPKDGSLVKDISTGTRMTDMAVRSDGQEMVVSVRTSKINYSLLWLNGEGETVRKEKVGSQVISLAYTKDETGLVLGNNRGEVTVVDLNLNEKTRYAGEYPVVSMSENRENGTCLVLFGDTSYVLLDENMEALHKGKPDGQASINPTCIYMDQEGNYIFEGTKERYFYVMDAKTGDTVYEDRLAGNISDITQAKDDIVITGLGDWVCSLSLADLASAGMARAARPVLLIFLPIFAVLALFSILMSFSGTGAWIVKAAKILWRFRLAYLLLVPIFVLLILFNYIPVFIAFTRAFTNWSQDNYAVSQLKFVGLDNFKTMITEGYFLVGIQNLLLILATGFIKVMTVPILVAYLVYSMRSGRKKYIFRFLLVLPVVVPSVVSALLWKQIYDPTIGLLNQTLGKLGLESLQHVWLGDEKTALWAIIFMGFPFVNAMAFLVFYGGFLNIDTAMLEAAKVDGASRFKIFWRVQIPQIMPQIKMMLILTFINSVQDFAPIYLLTGGGPGKSTYVPSLELYFNATQFGRYGYACALGLLMFAFILIPTILNMRSKKGE